MRTLGEADRERIRTVIDRHRDRLAACRGYLAATPGFAISGGRLVREPSIVVLVARKVAPDALLPSETLPHQLEGIRVDVQVADLETQLALLPGDSDWQTEAAALAVQTPTYVGLPGDPIDEAFTVEEPLLCHVGPDAGWVVLRDFLAGTRASLVASMYDFNADYIANTLIGAVDQSGITITLALDDDVRADREAPIQTRLITTLRDAYDRQIITCRAGARFPTAYHEKVAVRDGTSFWLSSGNWTTRSQPHIDPIGDPSSAQGMYSAGNREWHAIVDDRALAEVFARYIEHDRQQAQQDAALGEVAAPTMPDVFVAIEDMQTDLLAALAQPSPVAPLSLPRVRRPVSLRPVLSPDNYAQRASELIRAAQHQLFIQYSYINWTAKEHDQAFTDLLRYLGDLSWRDDFDLRVIVGSNDAASKVRILAENGWNENAVRAQSNVHNKGIVADGETVLISSQNWSGDGFLRNRDAGLIINDVEIAAYYQQIFLDDWDQRTRSPFGNTGFAMLALPEAPTPRGMVRLTWQDFHGE
jgi:phosphatidylserine/phosphatidylglycerophosphate/cardiolipin synthase-like enzyme